MTNLFKKSYNKYIGNSDYKKNVVILIGGRILAQVVPILLTPLLTRIYSPKEFGVFGVYMAIVSFMAMLSNARYSQATLLPKDKSKAQVIVLISSILTLLFSVLSLIAIFLIQDWFFSTLNIESINKYLPILILNIIFLSLYDIFFVYELREKRYKKLAINLIVQATVTISIRVLVGYWGHTEIGLLVSYLIGYIVAYILLFYKTDFKINIKLLVADGKALMKEYINFPKFTLLSDSLITLTTSLPSILLNKLFGSDSSGYFNLSEKVLGSPIWFITSSVGDVFRQEASEKYRNNESCLEVFKKTSKTLLFIGIIPFLLIFLVVPPLVPFVFGDAWSSAGDYIRILSLMYFSSFVVNPVSYIVYIVKKQKYAVLFQGIKFVSILIAFTAGYYFSNLILGLILWSVLITISNILIYFMLYKFAESTVE
jgi:O-antigen/teichoic acid export membrane protein